jgi:maltodextrin utilization protein YvdJ
MKKFLIPLLILPIVVPFNVGNTVSVTATIVSGEKKITKKITRNPTQLTRIQIQRKLTLLQSEMKTLKQKIKVVQSRIDRKTRMKTSHAIDDMSLKNFMEQYNEAERTAAELNKKLEDTASGVIQKVG